MKNKFYIVKVREGWYRLHVLPTHFCLGATDNIQALLNTVENITFKYKNPKGLDNRLSQLSFGDGTNKAMTAIYEKDFIEGGHIYKKEVVGAVEKGLERVKYNSPFHRLRRKQRPVVEQVAITTTKETSVKSKRLNTKVTRKISICIK